MILRSFVIERANEMCLFIKLIVFEYKRFLIEYYFNLYQKSFKSVAHNLNLLLFALLMSEKDKNSLTEILDIK